MRRSRQSISMVVCVILTVGIIIVWCMSHRQLVFYQEHDYGVSRTKVFVRWGVLNVFHSPRYAEHALLIRVPSSRSVGGIRHREGFQALGFAYYSGEYRLNYYGTIPSSYVDVNVILIPLWFPILIFLCIGFRSWILRIVLMAIHLGWPRKNQDDKSPSLTHANETRLHGGE